MADKILMNKNSLALLKNELKEYKTALPVFEMKEQKLKEEVQLVEDAIARLMESIDATYKEVKRWAAVMAEESIDLSELVRVSEVITQKKEIAGVEVEAVDDVRFEPIEIDLMETPLWVDRAVEAIQDQKANRTLVAVEEKNKEVLLEEMAEARRMKNALKEVFIPETKDNIRKIEIYLGDVERLSIGCSKLVKKKKQDKKVNA